LTSCIDGGTWQCNGLFTVLPAGVYRFTDSSLSEVWRGIDRNDDDVQHDRRPWQKTLNGMISATPDRVNF
jgi:hypothetical protein